MKRDFYKTIWSQEKPDRKVRASFLKKELDLFKKHKVKKVLDLGFGNGDNMIKLASLGYDVSGMDISTTGFNVARQKFKDKGFRGNLIKKSFYSKLPFKNNSLDAVYVYQALGHNRLPAIKKVFKEIYRVLRKGGIFSFKGGCDRKFQKKGNHYYLAPYLRRKLKLIDDNTYLPVGKDDFERGVIHYEFSMKKLVEEVTKVGFELVNKRRLKRGSMGLVNFRKI